MELQARRGAAQRSAVGCKRSGNNDDGSSDAWADDAQHTDELRAHEWSRDVHNFGRAQSGGGHASQHRRIHRRRLRRLQRRENDRRHADGHNIHNQRRHAPQRKQHDGHAGVASVCMQHAGAAQRQLQRQRHDSLLDLSLARRGFVLTGGRGARRRSALDRLRIQRTSDASLCAIDSAFDAQNGYFATAIVSGGGTTTLTLANAAGATVSGAAVLHDNSVPMQNAVKTADNAGGGTVFVPSAGWWVFNGTTDFTGLSLGNVDRVHFNTSLAIFNNPIIPRARMDFEGEPHTSTSFSYVNGSQLAAGTAYPLFLLEEPNSVTSVHFSRLLLLGNQPGQSVIYMDSGSDGGGVSGIVFDDVNYTANGKSTPIVMKGGFDFFFNRGNCQGQPSGFVPQSCLQMTNASQGVTGAGTAQVPGRVKVKGLYFAGNAIDIDCLGNGTNVAPVDFTFDTTIFESAVSPYLRLNCPTGIFTGSCSTTSCRPIL